MERPGRVDLKWKGKEETERKTTVEWNGKTWKSGFRVERKRKGEGK